MKKYLASFKTLTKFEKGLWLAFLTVTLLSYALSFLFSGGGDLLNLIASLIGVTALIFVAKGLVLGQLLTVVFSVFYGIISVLFSYYGEMLTYLGMTLPMSVFALISWLRNPYKGNKMEVKVSSIAPKQALLIPILTAIVTVIFYFVLKFGANIWQGNDCNKFYQPFFSTIQKNSVSLYNII